MNEINNRKLMQDIFAELSDGNDAPFIEAMGNDMKWIWMGSERWERTFNGKKKVLDELWSAVRQTLKPPYKVNANNFIAEGDYVVVEAIGTNATPDGKTYHNKYCWVCRIVDGKIRELKEYMDTDLVTRTFPDKQIPLIGKKFLVDFGRAKAILHFQSETSLNFIITEKDNNPCEETENVAIKLTELRNNLYMVTWKEKNKNTITQIHDLGGKIIHSDWTLPNGEIIHEQGTITMLDED